MLPEPGDGVRVGRADDPRPGGDRLGDVGPAEVEPRRQAVDLERDAALDGERVGAVEVERVLRPAADHPPGRVAEAADVGVVERRLDAGGHLRARHPLAAVDARLHPVQLRQHVVGEVEPPVREDVALDPAQDAERREQLVRGRDLLALAADVVRREALDGADRRRVVADRDVLVAAVDRGARHLLDRGAAVRPGRVAVQVAADVPLLDEVRGRAAERRLAQLRRAPGDAERRVDARLVRRVRERLERVDVGGRAGRAQERGAEPLGRGDDELDRDALDGHADGAPLVLLEQRDDLGQRGEARQERLGLIRRGDDREPLAGVAPAADVARRLAAERRRDRGHELAREVQHQRPLWPRLRVAGERVEELRLELRADAGHAAQPPGGRRLAQLLGGPDVERLRDLDRAPRGQPEVAAEPDQPGRQLALELGELRDVAGLDQLAQPRLDARADPAQLPHPPGGDEPRDRDRRIADHVGRAAVRADRVGVGLRQLQQHGEGVEAVGDLRVVHRGIVPL